MSDSWIERKKMTKKWVSRISPGFPIPMKIRKAGMLLLLTDQDASLSQFCFWASDFCIPLFRA
jgi:hypothetical protein